MLQWAYVSGAAAVSADGLREQIGLCIKQAYGGVL